MKKISVADRFRVEIRGKTHNDPTSLGLYATDASMYQMLPLAVVIPLDRDDTVNAVKLCAELGSPLLTRGGGTSLTGQSVSQAVILGASKHLTRVHGLNLEEGWARVEPGMVCREFNALLKPHGVHFAPTRPQPTAPISAA